MSGFSHIDQQQNPAMVDVGGKKETLRMAVAQSIVWLPAELAQVFSGGDLQTSKGSVVQTAVLAGIMAAKRTGELIPLCHTLGLENCRITIEFQRPDMLRIECMVSIMAKTGVEMEALVGASIAALTVYDMCKSHSHGLVIRETRLIKKTGGKNDFSAPS